jgi:hypothetical protein
VIGGNLDQDDLDAIGVLDPHLGQTPRLRSGLPDDRDSGRGQPSVLGVNIPDLEPDHHRAAGGAGPVPGDLEQSLAEEEHHPGILRGAELPVDSQAPRCLEQRVKTDFAVRADAEIGGISTGPLWPCPGRTLCIAE